MYPLESEEQLRVGFISEQQGDRSVNPYAVPVPELVSVLTALQRAVYASAAYELGLQSSKNLTDEQRSQFTLAVVGSETGSLWEILKWAAEGAVSTVAGNIAWKTVLRMLQFFRHAAGGDGFEIRQARMVIPYLAAIVAESNKTGRTVDITYRDREGTDFGYRTSAEGNERISGLAKELDLHPDEERLIVEEIATLTAQSDKIEAFEHGTVLDIRTTDHSLLVKFPYFPEPVSCAYQPSRESLIVTEIRALDAITVFGRVKQIPKGMRATPDFYIEVDGFRRETQGSHLIFVGDPMTDAPWFDKDPDSEADQ